MNLAKALEQQNISQRELGRRLGYDSNGAVSGVLKGDICVPMDKIPDWADALELKGSDRQSFIDYYADMAFPKWYKDRLEAAESAVVELRAEAAKLRAKIDKITIKRKQPESD